MNAKLFTPLELRHLKFKNRIFVSPMCQYSAREGVANNWHLVHLGSRAIGGAAMVMTEATAVSPQGRISPQDLGLWNDKQVEALKPITEFILQNGAVPAVQLAHAGRKASTYAPWLGHGAVSAPEGWTPLAPSPMAFDSDHTIPIKLSVEGLQQVELEFTLATQRALSAGFQVIELHMAHGYLMHQFLSPLSNQRRDHFGGSLENRMRFPLQVAKRVREVWPQQWPVMVRLSATDWVQDQKSWDLQQTLVLASELKKLGVDLIDCSTGGVVGGAKIPTGPGYQVQFAEAIRREVKIATGAVGMITDAQQAEKIVSGGQADAVFLARALLNDPYWPLRAAQQLGVDAAWPPQYERAQPRK